MSAPVWLPGHGDHEEGEAPPPDYNPAEGKLRRLDVARMLRTNPPPIPWLVEPLLIPGELTMLTGREGRGKSMLSQALAVALADPAAGGAVLGMPVKIGNVLIIDAENGPNEVHRRLHGTGLTDPARYSVYEALGLRLQDPDDLAGLHKIVRREKPAVVILDSLVSLAPGVKENEVGPVQVLLQGVQAIARETGAAILLLHHAGKGETGSEYRGSSAIGGVVTLGVTMTAHEGDPDQARRQLRWWKCRPCAKPDPIWLRITADDGRLRLEPTEPFEGLETGAPVRDGVAGVIVESLRDQGSAVNAARLAERIGRRRDDKTYRAALDKLVEAGHVLRDGDGLRVPGGAVVPFVVPTTPQDNRCGVVAETLGARGTTTTATEGIFGYEGEAGA